MKTDPTVFVVDQDPSSRRATQELLASVHLRVETFNSALAFLEGVTPPRPGCVVLETRLPGMSGLDLQKRLAKWCVPPPVIVVTAYGDIPMAVEAMRNGAIDFIEKPFRPQRLLDRVYEALEQDTSLQQAYSRWLLVESRAALLTPRERQVMAQVVTGLSNKAVAAEFGVTHKAVEAYRARVMRKMRAGSLAELVRMNVVLEQHAAANAADNNSNDIETPGERYERVHTTYHRPAAVQSPPASH